MLLLLLSWYIRTSLLNWLETGEGATVVSASHEKQKAWQTASPGQQADLELERNGESRQGVEKVVCYSSKGKGASKILNHFYARLVASAALRASATASPPLALGTICEAARARSGVTGTPTTSIPFNLPKLELAAAAVPVSFTLLGCSPVFQPFRPVPVPGPVRPCYA